MVFEFSGDSPIYLQLIRMIRQRIVAGELAPGSKLPSVRDLAVEYGVNPNTAQRSLAELEREGLVYADRTSGRFVTRELDLIEKVRKDLASEQIAQFIQQMQSMGFESEQVITIILEKWREQYGNH